MLSGAPQKDRLLLIPVELKEPSCKSIEFVKKRLLQPSDQVVLCHAIHYVTLDPKNPLWPTSMVGKSILFSRFNLSIFKMKRMKKALDLSLKPFVKS
jgi:hypothetical protein